MQHLCVNLKKAEEILSLLGHAFPTYPVSTDTAELYVEALERITDADAAVHASKRWVVERDHFPKIAELLNACHAEARRRAPAVLTLAEPDRPRRPIAEIREMFTNPVRQRQRWTPKQELTQGEPHEPGPAEPRGENAAS